KHAKFAYRKFGYPFRRSALNRGMISRVKKLGVEFDRVTTAVAHKTDRQYVERSHCARLAFSKLVEPITPHALELQFALAQWAGQFKAIQAFAPFVAGALGLLPVPVLGLQRFHHTSVLLVYNGLV